MTTNATSTPSDIPVNNLGFNWDDATLTRWSGKIYLLPEDYIGVTYVDEEGARCEINSIFRAGTNSITFKTLILGTEQGELLKIASFFFDLNYTIHILEKRLRDEFVKGNVTPDRIIEICDQLLELDPNHGIAAFNKATMLKSKRDFEQALEWYDVAITNQPNDYLNWLVKAECQIELTRLSDAVDSLFVAVNLDSDGIKKHLEQVERHAQLFESLLRQVIKYDPENEKALLVFNKLFKK